MKFGLYTGVHDLTLKRVYADVVDELREQVVLCEEAGFECVWVDEHHFNAKHTNSPNPQVFGAMLAGHTSRIRLGQANVVTGWHPLRLAEDVALLDHISKGRVDLSIGRGGEDPDLVERDVTYQAIFNPHPKGILPDPKLDVREHGLSSDQTALQKHFAEFVDILKKAWTEPFFSHQGTHYTFPQPGYPSILDAESLEDPAAVKDGEVAKIRLGPKPYQQPYPPLWMYLASEASFTEAARLGLKGMVLIQPANKLREGLETYTNIRNELEGGQLRVGDDINVIRLAYVAPTYEEAKKNADPLFTPLFAKQFERRPMTYWSNDGEAILERTDMDWEFYRKQLLILAGSPEQVAEQIQELREVGGVNYITLWMEGPGLSHEKIMSSIELFGSKVAPLFANDEA
jgi:alkanesulfonate monooxygenase SsuD/methylene tetrahydromethanopterin reductase-like flavin-dependent oxidoreductase (luciferase family)